MKIAIILPQLEKAGGAERVVTDLANYWQQQYEVMLITFTQQKKSYYHLEKNVLCYSLTTTKNIQCTLINQFNLFSKAIYGLYRLRKLLKYYKPDIAIGIDIKANFALSIASIGINNLVTIATEHRHPPTVPMPKFLLKIARFCCGRMHAMVALTKASQAWFQKNTRFKLVIVIPNPLVYPLAINKPIIKPKNYIKKKHTLLAVGRLCKEKGFDLLIPIFAKLEVKYNDWQLVILGEGDQRQQLELQIQQFNLENKVYMPGSVGNLAEWYKTADIFVFSSRYEGFGCALIEAMSYGLPVVSFDCPAGPSDIITHGIDGLLVENGNTEKLSKTLDSLMSNEILRKQIAIKALGIKYKYNINKIADLWQQLFKELSLLLVR